MNKLDLIKTAENFIENSQENYISEDTAISKQVVGLKLFDAPIFAFGAADDNLFELLKQPSAIGEHFKPEPSFASSCPSAKKSEKETAGI